MDFREYLMSLNWNTFSRYPEQGSSIYLHCRTEDDSVHKFLKIDKFNAVFLDLDKIVQSFSSNHQWQFSWLPANKIDRDYAKSTFNQCGLDGIADQAHEHPFRYSEAKCNSED